METTSLRRSLKVLLDTYAARWPDETAVLAQFREFLASGEVLQGKTNPARHITASTWIVDASRARTLLTHHAKLGKWVQLGGHTDEGEPWAEAAIREAREESGLGGLHFVEEELFDLDIHEIPARGDTLEHWHYDLRFLVEADPDEALTISEESRDLAWVPLDRLGDYTKEESQHRMARKTPRS